MSKTPRHHREHRARARRAASPHRTARDGRLGRAGSHVRDLRQEPDQEPGRRRSVPASPRSTRSAQFPAGRTRRASSAPPPTRSRTAGSPTVEGPEGPRQELLLRRNDTCGGRGAGDDRQADDQAPGGRGRTQGDAQRLARQLREELRAGAGVSSRTRAEPRSGRSRSARTRPSPARTCRRGAGA